MYGFIYETTCLINGKKYIGKRVYDKYGQWKNYLGSGKILKLAINKYGKENFERKIICECESKEELCKMERFYIKEFDAVKNQTYYNICSGGEGSGRPGVPFTEDHKKKISQALTGKKQSEEQNKKQSERMKGKPAPNRKKVICLETKEIFDSATSASKSLNTNDRSVANAIKKEQSIAGFHFEYLENYDPNKPIIDKKSHEYLSEIAKHNKGITKHAELSSKKVRCVELNRVFNSMTEAAKEMNVSCSNICNAIRRTLIEGTIHKCHGYTWEYV